MKYLFICGLPMLFIVAFLIWRLTSVGRGARNRDETIMKRIDPVGSKLADGKQVDPMEVEAAASIPSTRCMLYDLLKHYERLDLFPQQFLTREAQGESQLAYWMLHPNELQADPEVIEHVETLTRTLDGRAAEFYIYKYKMKDGHWAAKDGWTLGFAGPYFESSIPYESTGAFSKVGDKFGESCPDELIDWYIGLVKAKGT